MHLTIQQIRPATSGEWDAIWARGRDATYFHSRHWAETWERATGGRTRPAPRVVVFSDGRLALLPLSCQRLRRLWQRRVSSPAGTYGGWIAPVALDRDHAALLAAHLLDPLPALVVRTNPFDPTHAPLHRAAAEETEPSPLECTLAIDLAGGRDALERRWRRGAAARKDRAAARAGVEVRRATDERDWNAYDELYRASLARWGERATARYDRGLFDAIAARDSGHEHLWLAVRGRDVLAGALCFESAQITAYWHGAARAEAFPLRPVNRLLCAVIRRAASRGQRWFDLGPSGPHEGVAAFKRSLGATPIPCPVIRRRARIGFAPPAVLANAPPLRRAAA